MALSLLQALGTKLHLHPNSSRVIVPDMKGFGQSSAPLEVEKYSLKSLATDLVELLDHLKIERAIFCGHDHGGSIVICQNYFPTHHQ